MESYNLLLIFFIYKKSNLLLIENKANISVYLRINITFLECSIELLIYNQHTLDY